MNTKAILLLCSLFFMTTVTASEEPNLFKKKISYFCVLCKNFYTLCKKKLSRKKQSDESTTDYDSDEAAAYYEDDLYKHHPIIEHEWDEYIGGVVDDYSGKLVHGIQKDKLVRSEWWTQIPIFESCPIKVVNKVGSITVTQSEDSRITVFRRCFIEEGFEHTLEESYKVEVSSSGQMFCFRAQNTETFLRAFLDYHIQVPNGRKILLSTHFNFPIDVSSVEACYVEGHSSKGPITLDLWAPFIKAGSAEGDIFCKRAQSQGDKLVEIKRRARAIVLSYWRPSAEFGALPKDIAKYISQLAVEEVEKYTIELRSKGNIEVVLPPESSGTVDVYPRDIFSTNFQVVSSQKSPVGTQKITQDSFSAPRDTGSIIKFGKNVVTSNNLVLAISGKEFMDKKIKLRKSE